MKEIGYHLATLPRMEYHNALKDYALLSLTYM